MLHVWVGTGSAGASHVVCACPAIIRVGGAVAVGVGAVVCLGGPSPSLLRHPQPLTRGGKGLPPRNAPQVMASTDALLMLVLTVMGCCMQDRGTVLGTVPSPGCAHQ